MCKNKNISEGKDEYCGIIDGGWREHEFFNGKMKNKSEAVWVEKGLLYVSAKDNKKRNGHR